MMNTLARTSLTQRRRGGFTLVEIFVVLLIGTLLSSLIFGGLVQARHSNRRTSCQTNMSQVYLAGRLYATDMGNFPFHDTAAQPEDSPGLWLLYTFPDATQSNGLVAPASPFAALERYVRTPKLLHCPADGQNDSLHDDNKSINLNYLSYQTRDGDTPTPATSDDFTYKPIRTEDASDANLENWKRQLVHIADPSPTLPDSGDEYKVAVPPTDDTVVFWCKWHRNDPQQRTTRGVDNGLDNVLFYDGSIQTIPAPAPGEAAWRRGSKKPS